VGERQLAGPGSGLFRSRDGGTTWTQLTKGLPTVEQGLGRNRPRDRAERQKRLYAGRRRAEDRGIFRSDDAAIRGRASPSTAPVGRGNDFAK
jgi:hypothetical protein